VEEGEEEEENRDTTSRQECGRVDLMTPLLELALVVKLKILGAVPYPPLRCIFGVHCHALRRFKPCHYKALTT
jgi:hypothetical protein